MTKTFVKSMILLFAAMAFLSSCKKATTTTTDPTPTPENVVVSGLLDASTTWTADKIYELAGKVVVGDGVTLTIQPGTIVKGRTGAGSLASALVVAQGGKINAVGTAAKPIIFTSVLDNIKIGETSGTNLDENDREKWGGMIILGKAPVSTGDGDVIGQVEGIPADEPYGKYGGEDPADNSGTLAYVSIRHGGAVIGEGNEINGLTLGGVGNGTTIHHIEIVANLDDGIEFFGGTVNLNDVVIAFQDDDGLDIDQNYSGTIDNFYVVHGGSGTDEGLEIDGPEGSTHTDGLFTLQNGTIRTVDGNGSGADLKSKAQGTIKNVTFEGYSKFVKVSAKFDEANSCAEKTDAYTHAIGGTLNVTDCEIKTGAVEDMYNVYSKQTTCFDAVEASYQAALDNAWSQKGNAVVSSFTKGATDKTAFDWTWAKKKGFIQ
ncbi:MAG TPA: hypothetical protein ENK85_11890 [Saprospiraceae bacterium]|nr:hypothetical protein [Saprospiraceae bacterium]